MRYTRFFYISFAVLTLLALVYYFFIDGLSAGSGAGTFAWITGILAVLAYVLDTVRAKSLNDRAAR